MIKLWSTTIERPLRAASNIALILGVVVSALPLPIEALKWLSFFGWILAARSLVWLGETRMLVQRGRD